jgi:hypothetical protein
MDSSSTLSSRDANLSQPTKSPGKSGSITSTAVAGEKSVFESTGVESVATLPQSIKKEEGESGIISQDDEGSQGEADMDICEESEDAEEWTETKDGMIVKEETGGMEPGPTTSEIPIPPKLQRFYFESDTLALKNNPE